MRRRNRRQATEQRKCRVPKESIRERRVDPSVPVVIEQLRCLQAGRRFDCGSVAGFVEATNYYYENFFEQA